MKEPLKTFKVKEALHRLVKMYCAERGDNMIDFVETAIIAKLPPNYKVKKEKQK